MIYEQFLALTEADEKAKAGFWKGLKQKAGRAGKFVADKSKSLSGYNDIKAYGAHKKMGDPKAAKAFLRKGVGKAAATTAVAAGLTAGGIALGKHLKKKKESKKD